jgi:hypothetical protein
MNAQALELGTVATMSDNAITYLIEAIIVRHQSAQGTSSSNKTALELQAASPTTMRTMPSMPHQRGEQR